MLFNKTLSELNTYLRQLALTQLITINRQCGSYFENLEERLDKIAQQISAQQLNLEELNKKLASHMENEQQAIDEENSRKESISSCSGNGAERYLALSIYRSYTPLEAFEEKRRQIESSIRAAKTDIQNLNNAHDALVLDKSHSFAQLRTLNLIIEEKRKDALVEAQQQNVLQAN